MAVDRWSEVLALVACVVGIIVVVVAWPRRSIDPRPVSVPEEPAPIAVKLDTIGHDARWRVANRHDILDVTIDIVTFRVAGSDDGWSSEPIVEPVALSPGRSATLPTVIDDPSLTYDVAIAWTVHHLGDDVPGRRIFRVSPGGAPLPPPPVVAPSGDVRGLAVLYGGIAVLLCAGAVIAGWRLLDASGGSSGVTATPETVPPGTVTTTVAAATTVVTPATIAPSPVTTTSVVPVTTTSVVPVTTTTSPPTTAPATSAPSSTVVPSPIVVRGRIAPCRFGPACLIADFRLDGFPREGDYVCEFADGSRFTFRYEGDGADDACSAIGPDAAITIEVDGIRSNTITRTDLNEAR